MNRKIKQILMLVGILFVLFFLYATIRVIIEGEEGRIKRFIYSGKAGIEKENIIKCMSCISFDYKDPYGNDRQKLLILTKEIFREYDNITLKIGDLKIELNGENAQAEMEVLGYGRPKNRPDQRIIEYNAVDLKLNLRKEEQGWKVNEMDFKEQGDILSSFGLI